MSKYIAIDLDPQGIFVVSGSSRAGHAKVDMAVAWDGTDGEGPPALTLETAKAIGEQLLARLKAAGVATAPVVVSIPRDRVILKELRYPEVPPTEEPHVVRFQAMKELTDAADDVVIDYVPMAMGTVEGERHSMAFAFRKDLLAAIQALCTAANLKLAAVTPRPYAVAAGLTQAIASGALPRTEAPGPMAVLTLGTGGGGFSVFRLGSGPGGHEVLFSRTVPAPAMMTETALAAEVRRDLTMYAGANPAHPVQALYVADTEGRWATRLRAALGIPVHAYDPLAGTETVVPEPTRGRFAGAVGMLAAMSANELAINFFAPRQPRIEKDPKQKQILLGAGLAFLVVAAGVLLGMLYVNSVEEDLARLQLKKADLEAEAAQLEPDYKRFQAVKQWKSRQVVWLDMLYDLTDQFRHTDGMVAVSYVAKTIPPDMKTGKQLDGQATVDIKVTARKPNPVDAVLAAMDADNRLPRTTKDSGNYYLSQYKMIGSTPAGDPLAKEYVIRIKVTNRPPGEFTRLALFAPPSRRSYPPVVISKKEEKEKEDPSDLEFP